MPLGRTVTIRILAVGAVVSGLAAQQPSGSWVERSNQNAMVVIRALVAGTPEAATMYGLKGYDEEISRLVEDPGPLERAEKELKSRLALETDPHVRHDLEIILQALDRLARSAAVRAKHDLPFADPAQDIWMGCRRLSTDGAEPERRAAAVVRLRRYAGMEPGYEPYAILGERRIRSKMTTLTLTAPSREQIESMRRADARLIEEIQRQLVSRSKEPK